MSKQNKHQQQRPMSRYDEALAIINTMVKDVDATFADKKFDRRAKDYKKRIEYEALKTFERDCESLELSRGDGMEQFHASYEKYQMKRACTAIAEMMPEAISRFGACFPEENLEAEFIKVCAMAKLNDINQENRRWDIVLAAALFMLDELHDSGNLHQAKQYLRKDIDHFSVDLPDCFEDLNYSDGLILSMMQLIVDKDIKPGEKNKNNTDLINRSASIKKPFTGNYSAADKEISDMTNKERFDAVMSLLRRQVIKRAEDRFIDDTWRRFDKLLSESAPFNEAQRQNIADFNYKVAQTKNLIDGKLQISPLKAMQEYQSDAKSILGVHGFLQNFTELDNNMADLADLIDSMENCEAMKRGIRLVMNCLRATEGDAFKASEAYKDYSYDISQFQVLDPCETCFALIVLLDRGSHYPWLFGLSSPVISTADSQLPWFYAQKNAYEDYEEEEEELEEFDSSGDLEDEEKLDPADEYVIDWAPRQFPIYDCKYRNLERRFAFGRNMKKKHGNLNLAQLYYEETDTVLPRQFGFYGPLQNYYKRAGVKKNEFPLFEKLLELSATGKESLLGDFDETQFVKEKEDDTNLNNEEIIDDLRKKLKVAKEENDKLRSTIHDLQKSAADGTKYEKERSEENEAEHLELLKLRKMILEQKGEAEAASELSTVEWPYITTRKIISVGGHDTFLSKIRPLLPNVRFVDANTTVNSQLIRNADAVWIQPNCISHSNYYKVMNLVRDLGIPYFYFSYAGADKCAVQLVTEDVKIKAGE